MKSNDKDNPQKLSLASGGEGDSSMKPETPQMNAAEGGLDTHTQVMIGQRLKAVYGEIVRQPVPDDLLRLLDELAAKEQRQ